MALRYIGVPLNLNCVANTFVHTLIRACAVLCDIGMSTDSGSWLCFPVNAQQSYAEAPTSRRQNSSLERNRKNAEIREDGIDGGGTTQAGEILRMDKREKD